MRRDWSAEELSELWTLGPAELVLVGGLPDASKLGLAAQLAYWRVYGRFPDDEADLSPAAVGHLAAQLGIGADALEIYDWAGRTGRRHRRLIPDYLAVADFDDLVEARFRRWLGDELLPRELSPAVLEGEVSSWFARERITRPGAWRLDRILRRRPHDDAVLQRVADRLDAGARERLDALLTDNGEGTAFAQLAADPGRIGHPVPRRRGRGWMSQGRCARGNLSRCRPGYAGGAGARGLHARNAVGPSRAYCGARLLRVAAYNHRTPGSQSSAIWAHAR